MAFDCASVLVTLPLLNYFVYPYMGRRGRRLTLHVRIAIGILLGSAACIMAGVVETVRLDRLVSGVIKQHIGNTIYDAASMSVLYQIPQYILMGSSEAFAYVTAMEYTYLLASKAVGSIMIGAMLAFSGAGALLSAGLDYAYRAAWVSSQGFNCFHCDYLFYSMASMQLVCTVVFLVRGKQCDVGLDRLTINVRRPLPSLLAQPTAGQAATQ